MEFIKNHENEISRFAAILDGVITVDDMFPPDEANQGAPNVPRQPLPSDVIGRQVLQSLSTTQTLQLELLGV